MIKQVREICDITPGDLLITVDCIGDKTAFQCKEIINPKSGREEILLSDDGTNKYFIWSMFVSGASWVKELWVIKECGIHENTTSQADDKCD